MKCFAIVSQLNKNTFLKIEKRFLCFNFEKHYSTQTSSREDDVV